MRPSAPREFVGARSGSVLIPPASRLHEPACPDTPIGDSGGFLGTHVLAAVAADATAHPCSIIHSFRSTPPTRHIETGGHTGRCRAVRKRRPDPKNAREVEGGAETAGIGLFALIRAGETATTFGRSLRHYFVPPTQSGVASGRLSLESHCKCARHGASFQRKQQ